MKKRRMFVSLLTLGMLLLLTLTIGLSQAQGPEETESPEVPPSGSGAVEPVPPGLSSAPEPAADAPSPVSGDIDPTVFLYSSMPVPPGVPIESLSPPDQPAAADSEDVEALQDYSYLRITGSALRPRGSDVSWLPGGQGGCIYLSGGSIFRWWNTPVYLPQGATVKYMRMYYNDTHATNNCQGFFSVYDLYGDVVDEWGVSSSGSPGEDFRTTSEFTHTVDYSSYSYVVNWRPNEDGNDMQLCGFRIYYYAPSGGAAYLPYVTKDSP